ncbi:hypothetical protein EYF80_047109 [Liparis tanakae]|uniref:Uncharacterized protein n=1 Tax=Liparis tanakae TaxID=230148 RepID=A0A4Z2FN92_9TELE|nr:hypothetical protein EYF80_047109 [Liparis tanakae]
MRFWLLSWADWKLLTTRHGTPSRRITGDSTTSLASGLFSSPSTSVRWNSPMGPSAGGVMLSDMGPVTLETRS